MRDQLSYREEIDDLQQRYGERFHYVPITSRETVTDALHGRILAALEERRLEQHAGVKLSAEDSHVMLCGNMGMIREVSAALEARGMRKNRKQEPGHYTTEKYH
ncbi:MAG: ferredoxin--NADP(+) reductase, partial [Candidatus Thiodiazotropha sp.]